LSTVGEVADAALEPSATQHPHGKPRLRQALAGVGGVVLIVKLLLTMKDLVVARVFGTSVDLDVFLVAFAVSQFAMTIIAGAFASAVVPTYIQVRERDGRPAAVRLFGATFSDGMRLLVGAAVVLSLAGPLLLGLLIPAHENAGPKLAVLLFFLLLPTLLLNGASTAWAAILGAEERYASSVAPQLLAPVVPLVVVLILSAGQPDVRWLAIGTTLGFALEAVAAGWLLHRAGIRILPRRAPATVESKVVLSQFLPVAAGACMMASTVLVDQAMAVRLAGGSVAALSYGGKAISFLASAGSLTLSAAALPHFSKVVATSDGAQLLRTLRRWVILVLAVTIPTMALLIAVSHPLVKLLFEQGAFTAEDTRVVSRVQQLLLLQLPAYLVMILFVRAISALKASGVIFWAAAINLVVNVVLNLVFGAWLGIAGIALSTSAVYWISAGFVGTMLVRRLARIRVLAERAAPPDPVVAPT
jgi:putative peptidoglycan lipid II flippase